MGGGGVGGGYWVVVGGGGCGWGNAKNESQMQKAREFSSQF